MFRTSNPALNRDEFRPAQTWQDLAATGRLADAGSAPARAARADHMTISGTVNKSFFVLAICVATALVSWNIATGSWDIGVNPWVVTFGGAISGLVLCLVWCFAPKTAPVTVPMYAMAEGLFVGGISAAYATLMGDMHEDGKATALNTGLVFNSALLTFGIFGGLLAGYATKVIRPGPWFRKAVITAMFGLLIYIAIAFIGSFFSSSFETMRAVFDPTNGSWLSIGVSLFLVALASANFVLDFEMIEHGAANRAPKYYEWVGAGGLLVTLVWLYLEMLRLLSKIQSRD